MNFRKISYLIITAVLALNCITVQAAESQLRIFLGKDAKNVELSIYDIAESVNDEFELLPEYEGLEIDFSNLTTAQESKEAAEEVYGWIQENAIVAEQKTLTNEEGKAVFLVEKGLYLLMEESDEGEMAPVLLNVLEEFDGEYIDISPKYSVNKPDADEVGNALVNSDDELKAVEGKSGTYRSADYVIDHVAPELTSVKIGDNDVVATPGEEDGGKYFYKETQELKLTIDERFFAVTDNTPEVILKSRTDVTADFTGKTYDAEWAEDADGNWSTTVVLEETDSNECEYQVEMKYTDASGNKLTGNGVNENGTFVSQIFVVEKVAPKIVSYEVTKTTECVVDEAEVRKNAEAFLSKRLIVCEGKTEMGFVRALDTYLAKTQKYRMAYKGVGTADGCGSMIFKGAEIFQSCGYDICLLMDSDLAEETEEKLKIGLEKVYDWDEPNSFEEQIFYDVSIEIATQLINIAVKEKGIDSVKKRLDDAKIPYEMVDEEVRLIEMNKETQRMIGSIAKKKKVEWYKRIDLGEAVGTVLFENWQTISKETKLHKNVDSLIEWVMKDDRVGTKENISNN